MENNHKKRKVMLIAAFAVAVIALAGVGYAVSGLGYKGTTVNNNNSADGKYIVVTQSDSYTGVFNAIEGEEINIDTYTDAGYTTTKLYSLADSTDLGTILGTHYYGAQIGDDLTFTIAGDTADAYDIIAKSTGTLNGTGTDGWVYILELTGSGTAQYIVCTGTAIDGTISNLAATGQSITAKLYIASSVLFQNITTPAPLVVTNDVPNYDEPTAKISPLVNGHLFNAINVIFTFEPVA